MQEFQFQELVFFSESSVAKTPPDTTDQLKKYVAQFIATANSVMAGIPLALLFYRSLLSHIKILTISGEYTIHQLLIDGEKVIKLMDEAQPS